jgi:hypothetical protein
MNAGGNASRRLIAFPYFAEVHVMAVLALGVVGSALGSAIGIGASAGWLGGVLLGNLLFGGGKGQNIEGPRIDDLSVQTSTYGAPIPLVYGTMRISGNVIWSTPLKETRTVKKSSGGKGGGKKSSQTTYSYSVSFAVGLCSAPWQPCGVSGRIPR